MLMVINQANVDESERYVTCMLHDMIPTQSMTDTMGGGDVVVETANNECTSCATEIMCGVGHSKQSHTQASICECCRECGEDTHTLQSKLNNAMHENQHTHHDQVGETAVDRVCNVGKSKSLPSHLMCCRGEIDPKDVTYTPKMSVDTHTHARQHTTYMGVGGGGDGIVSEEMVGEERTGAVPSTRGCARVQTNTKEDSHKLANTQKECTSTHTYSTHRV